MSKVWWKNKDGNSSDTSHIQDQDEWVLIGPFGEIRVKGDREVVMATFEWLEEDSCWKRVRKFLKRLA